MSAPLFFSVARLLLCLGTCVLAVPALAQRGALVVHRDLTQMVSTADTIVRGHVAAARVERHPEFKNLHTVVVVVTVEKALKGAPGKTYTFRQFIWDARDRYDAAGYRKGDEFLLLMNPVNENGLTSPVALDQGRFRIQRDAQGNATALNGRGNVRLFETVRTAAPRGLSQHAARTISTHRHGPIPLDDLEDVIAGLARSK